MLQFDGNVDMYKLGCKRIFKYNIIGIFIWQNSVEIWEIHAEFYSDNLKGRRHIGKVGIRRRTILVYFLKS
jgi:hypothetical protein